MGHDERDHARRISGSVTQRRACPDSGGEQGV